MSGRKEGYYGPSADDLGRGALGLLAVVFGVALAVALCVASCDGGDSADDPDKASRESDTGWGFAIDPADKRAMHAARLPAKSDVLGWHMNGRWGFPVDGGDGYTVLVFHDLPGGAWVWDALYGIDADDPSFRFKEECPYGDEA